MNKYVFTLLLLGLSRICFAQTTDTTELSAVVVRGQKPLLQQITGGFAVNVGNSVMTKGSSALAVLERSPGVLIDRRNNSIALNGKNGVTIMLDGKSLRLPIEQVATFLEGMSGDNIEKIELLTTPPSLYDAEGSGGVINIVTKKNKKGSSASISLNAGIGWGEKGGGTINAAHNTKKYSLYGGYTFGRNRTYSDLDIISAQDMPAFGGPLTVLFRSQTRALQQNHDANAGIDININRSLVIGGQISYNQSSNAPTTVTQARYITLPDSVLEFDGRIKGNNHWRNGIGSVYAEKKFSDNEKLRVELDYLQFQNNNPTTVENTFVDKNGTQPDDPLFSPLQQGIAKTNIRVGIAKIDYSKQLRKNLQVEVGVKGSYASGSSMSGIRSFIDGEWIDRQETTNNLEMEEKIGAAYTSFKADINEGTRLVFGARYERASMQMKAPQADTLSIDRLSGTFFPGLSVIRKLNKQSSLELSYSKRISRPTYNDLASYVGYSDPTAVYTGNPLLKPTLTTNYKLGYTFKSYSISLIYSIDKNPVARFQLTESPARNLLYVSPQNLAWQKNINAQINLPININNWWNMQFGFNGGKRHFRIEYTATPVEKSYFGYSFNSSHTFTLPRSYMIELSGWYNGSGYNGTVKMKGFGTVSAGVRKGNFQLAVSDIFSGLRIHNYYGTLTKEAFAISNHVLYRGESARMPVIRLTYSRTFGLSANKPGNQSKDSPEELNRIRKE